MANDDYGRVLYLILYSLYEALREGRRSNLDDISLEVLKINRSYWLSVIEDACSMGLIQGIRFRYTKIGRIAYGLEDMQITFEGTEFLQENSRMKKVYEALKELRDWI